MANVPLPRVTTGVPGLDVLLGGGLVRGGLYLLEGVPGAGKTVLATQVAFAFARAGGRVLFVTLVAESHGKLLRHLSGFDFYDAAAIGRQITLLSAFQTLLDEGLSGLTRFIGEALREHACELLVLDGFAAAREFSDDTRSLGRFIHQLNTLVGAMDATALLLAPLAGTSSHPEHTLVDGLVELRRVASGQRRAREIEVHKMRGGRHLTGQHVFEISSRGVHVFPRLETLPCDEPPPAPAEQRLGSGIPTLDPLIGGGMVAGSATSLLGAPGVGKTLFGLSFLAAGAARRQPALYFGFYESPARLVSKAAGAGLALDPWLASGTLFLEWQPALEIYIDRAAQDLLRMVRERGIQRVFIDGAEGFRQGAFHPERISRFLTALTAQLRAGGVTTLLAEELPLFTPLVQSKVLSLSAMVENVLLLRFVEHQSRLRRLLSVIKLRDSDFDPGIREFQMGPGGIVVGESIVGLEQVLGSPHGQPTIAWGPGGGPGRAAA